MLTPILLPFILFFSVAVAVDTEVKLSYAAYEGTALANGVTQWLGIRYAAPPIGELRFAAPQDPLAEAGVQAANKVTLTSLNTAYVC